MSRQLFTDKKILTGLGVLFLGSVALSAVRIALAVAPDPGHNFTAIAGGVAQGDLLFGSAADTLSALPKDTNTTRYLSNTGSSNNPAWAQVNVANGVTGSLPVDVQTFTSTGANTWNKPSVGRIAFVQIWGGGGSGGRGGSGTGGGGGGGGGYAEAWVPLASLGNSETCSVATGGAAQTVDDTDGSAGGNTTFADSGDVIPGAVFTAFGGGGGCGTSAGDCGGGGGGGPTAAGSVGTQSAGSAVSGAGGGGSLNISGLLNFDTLGGPGGSTGAAGGFGGHSYWGGGGGGRGENSAGGFPGGNSIYGGAGGGGGTSSTAGTSAGFTLYGGAGGGGNFDANPGGTGAQPGGGGGGSELGNSGAGGNGKCVITVY